MFRIAHCRIESSAEVSTSQLGAGRLHMHTEHRGYLDTFHRFRVLVCDLGFGFGHGHRV